MKVVKNNGYASFELQNNYEIVIEEVKNNGYILEYHHSNYKIIMKL
jgi:hypothetical protein